MSSIALALKYRPTSFDDLVGQNAISQTLRLALDSKHISHAYLFSGLRGSGKTSSARIFARSLQCEKGPTSTPCGECASCKAALQNKHIDIIEMDAASTRGIDDIKRVIEQTKYHPSFARFKIFIIDEVHMLSKEAFNALLKTLEEPPEFVKFILATTDPLKLPATILSRTQHFRFKQIPQRLVVEHIAQICNKESVRYEAQALEILARSGSGSLRDTLTLLDQAIIFCKNHIEVAGVADMLGVVDPQVLNSFFQSIMQKDEAKAYNILAMLQEYECEMILDEMMSLLKEKLIAKDIDFPPLIVDRYARILSQSKSLLNLNTDGAFVLLLCMLKMQEALKIKDIESMISELENDIFSQNAPKHITSQNTVQNKETKSLSVQHTLNPQMLFQTLITRLKDRNLELGDSFENCISFVSFEEQTLCWESRAQGLDKGRLREHYNIIKSIVEDVFGAGVNIKQATKTQDSLSKIDTNHSQTQTSDISVRIDSNVNTNPNADINAHPNLQSQETQAKVTSSQHNQFVSQNKEIIRAIEEKLGIKEVIYPKNIDKIEKARNV